MAQSPDRNKAMEEKVPPPNGVHGAMLENAQTMADMQQRQLKEFSAEMNRAERRTLGMLDVHLEEVSRLADENKGLRLQVAALSADLAAFIDSGAVSEEALARASQRLAELQTKLTERELQLKVLEPAVAHLPQENERLLRERQALLAELEEMRRQISSISDGAVASPEALLAQRLQLDTVHRDVAREQMLLAKACRTREAIEASQGLALRAEAENAQKQLTLEKQRRELGRLHDLVDAMNHEKALIPPTVLAISGSVFDILAQRPSEGMPDGVRLGLHPTAVDAIKNALLPELVGMKEAWESTALAPERLDETGIRGAGALQQMRALEQQGELMTELLQTLGALAERQMDAAFAAAAATSGIGKEHGYFYFVNVLHTMVDSLQLKQPDGSPQKPPGFTKRLLGARAGELVVCHTDKPEAPLYTMEAWKTSTALNREKLLIVLKHRPIQGEPPDIHLIKLKNIDEFNRWFYALKYAGFLPGDIDREPVAVAPPVTKIKAVAPPPPKEDRQPRVLMLSPTGEGPNGVTIPFFVDDMLPVFDLKTNMVNLKNAPTAEGPEVALSFDASHALCIINPIAKEFYIYYFDPEAAPDAAPCKLLLKPKTQQDFEKLVPLALEMRWKETIIGPDREPQKPPPPPPPPPLPKVVSPPVRKRSVILKPKKVAKPPPPKTEPEAPPFNPGDLFIVENRELKLFEKIGDPKPVLTLRAEDCISLADDKKREFVLVYKERTPEEETYVFTFDNDEVYQEKKQNLIDNDFFLRRRQVIRDTEKRDNQVCVVQKGRMDMYRHYGSPGDKPLLTMIAERATADASRERREIRLVQEKEGGGVERATLDCSTGREFDRWYIALLFGGFLKEVTEEDEQRLRGLSHLTKYIFPINLFGPGKNDPRCVRVEGEQITIYAHPDDKSPVFVFKKADIDVTAELANRRFRIFRYRYTKNEERCDIVMHLATEFDRLQKALQAGGFLESRPTEPGRRISRVSSRFVLAKKLILNVYENKQATRPAAFYRALDYLGIADALASLREPEVVIRPRGLGEENTLSEALAEIDAGAEVAPVEERLKMPTTRFSVKDSNELQRWRFAFFIARMDIEQQQAPRFFIPSIIYGFNSDDIMIPETGKKATRSSFMGSFFGRRRESGAGAFGSTAGSSAKFPETRRIETLGERKKSAPRAKSPNRTPLSPSSLPSSVGKRTPPSSGKKAGQPAAGVSRISPPGKSVKRPVTKEAAASKKEGARAPKGGLAKKREAMKLKQAPPERFLLRDTSGSEASWSNDMGPSSGRLSAYMTPHCAETRLEVKAASSSFCCMADRPDKNAELERERAPRGLSFRTGCFAALGRPFWKWRYRKKYVCIEDSAFFGVQWPEAVQRNSRCVSVELH